MEENKNLTPETELEAVAAEEASDTTDKKAKKEKVKKPKKLKNQALLKRGGYSLAITAAVVAGAIVLNVLVGALTDRFVLEFDMTANKENTISKENIEYIKLVEDEVEVIFCADVESYVGGYMEYYSQMYSVNDSAAAVYYEQTTKLVDRYADYNDNINVSFIDTQSAEFAQIASEYSNESISYGDIIVSCEKDGIKRHKILGYTDIYSLTEDSTYAMYGYTAYTVSGNRIETALTSAIDYVTSDKIKKLAILTGHSSYDYTSTYQSLLEDNNYEIDIISDGMITSIPNEYDAILIAAPTVDFLGSELDAISTFLDNDGMLSKGLLFFADVNSPYLTNLYDFLSQWGINIDDGVLFETDTSNHLTDDPLTMGAYSSGLDDITDGMSLFLTGNNVPITSAFDSEGTITVTSLVATPASVIAAPKGTTAGWTEADDYTKQSYSAIIQSEKMDYDDEGNEINSYVIAFNSIDYLDSQYNEQAAISNKDITVSAAERAVGADVSDIYFVSKTITNESFTVTEGAANVVRVIFIFAIPIIILIAGIFVYIRRRNA